MRRYPRTLKGYSNKGYIYMCVCLFVYLCIYGSDYKPTTLAIYYKNPSTMKNEMGFTRNLTR